MRVGARPPINSRPWQNRFEHFMVGPGSHCNDGRYSSSVPYLSYRASTR